jgi:L-seryl-tRNA(Ser) seleniumtransferase
MTGSPAAAIPSVERLLHGPVLAALLAEHGRSQVLTLLRTHLEELRQAALAGTLASIHVREESVAAAIEAKLRVASRLQLRPVFNLTGTVLHTNLGRALLPEEAIAAVATAQRTAVNLEYDLKSGRRGERDDLIEPLLCELTGAQAATVVNNNAAAVLLLLSALAPVAK